MMAHLGLYYAEKTTAGIAVRYFQDTGDEQYRQEALTHMEQAIRYWKAYAAEFSAFYKPQLYGRLQAVVYPELVTADVEKDISIIEKWTAKPIAK